MKNHIRIFIILLAFILGALPLYAQESCYAQYLREHNMRVLTAEDADDSYDELKKAVLAWQLYGSEASLPLCPIEEPAAPKLQDTTCVIVHLALVDSTWYMWLSVDPLADKYPGNTPYMYCLGNPIMLFDPTGEWIAVVSNDDTGTSYTVVGGSVDVEDCNVYVVGNDYDPNSGIKPQGATILGQTASPYSFCNEKGNIVPGAVINMEDKSGDAFLAQFQTGEIPLWNYVFDDPNQEGNLSGRNNGNCDFKCGGDVNRGMPLSILGGKIGTARDVGNFAAGYLSGVHGIPLLFTIIAFDCLQKGIEPPVSRSAQNIGYFTGYYKYLIQQNHDTK